MTKRSDESILLQSFADMHTEKQSMNKEMNEMLAKEKVISLSTARHARRSGFLKRATDDLYQSASTGNFWRINKANNTVERVVDVDAKGQVKE